MRMRRRSAPSARPWSTSGRTAGRTRAKAVPGRLPGDAAPDLERRALGRARKKDELLKDELLKTMSKRRAVVTGLGAVTPLGVGKEASWKAILAGESGAGPITRFDAADYPVRFAAEVKGF